MTDYLHYWFNHANIDMSTFQSLKSRALVDNIRQLEQRRAAQKSQLAGDANANEMVNLIGEEFNGGMIGQGLESSIKEIVNQDSQSNRQEVGTLGRSLQQLGAMSREEKLQKGKMALSEAKKLVNDLGNIIGDLDNMLEDMLTSVTQLYPEAQLYVLKAMSENNLTGGAMTAAQGRQLVEDALNKNLTWIDAGNMSATAVKLGQNYVRLKQRVEALRVLDDTPTGRSYSVRDKGYIISQLLGKIGGTVNAVNPKLEEVIVAQAANNLLEKEKEMFDQLEANVVSSLPPGTKTSKDYEQLMDVGLQEGNYSNNSVVISMTKDNVTLDYGLMVRTSRPSKMIANGGYSPIKIYTPTLQQAFETAIAKDQSLTWNHINNLAAGVLKDDGSGYNSYSETGVARTWADLVKSSVYLNFVDYLIGQSGGINNWLLIANRQVYSMSDVIYKVVTNEQAIQINGHGALIRKNFSQTAMDWEGYGPPGTHRSVEKGLQRSSKITAELEGSTYRSYLLEVKLNLGMLAASGLQSL